MFLKCIDKNQKIAAWVLFFSMYAETVVAAHYGLYRMDKIKYEAIDIHKATKPETVLESGKTSTENNIITLDAEKKKEIKKDTVTFIQGKIEKDAQPNIGGPGQPEMTGFKSVGADNMVNMFSGDFSYNIPLLDIDGYPVNIFYNAAPSMEQEASWVGLGWNINPGTISRNMRGIPDDFDGTDKITKTQSIKQDITIGVGGSIASEIVGIPGARFSAGLFYNNKKGIGMEIGASKEFTYQKSVSKTQYTGECGDTLSNAYFGANMSLGLNLGSQTGLTPSVSFSRQIKSKDLTSQKGLSTSIDFNSRTGLGDLNISAEIKKYEVGVKNIDKGQISLKESSINWSIANANISFARSTFTPSINMPLSNFNGSLELKFGKEQKVFFKQGTLKAYYTQTYIRSKDKTQSKPAYGYMFYEKANNDENALLDFNRLNEGSITPKTPLITLPVYTYDVFSISGEGTGGNFRGYRGNLGYVRDHYVETKTAKASIGIDIGVTDVVHPGVTLGGVYSKTKIGNWNKENTLKQAAVFKENERLEQGGFYFKNPGESAIIDEDYYNKMGGDQLMRPSLHKFININTSILLPTVRLENKYELFNKERVKTGETGFITQNDTYRKTRDKRTQIITTLNAEEADRVGLDTYIYSYAENQFKPGQCQDDYSYKTPIRRYNPLNGQNELTYRKKHHLSEITVLQNDTRYIYGIPVYQKKQKEVSFSIMGTGNNGLIPYIPNTDNSFNNTSGKDHIYKAEEIPAYAHSFLLTAILSPDYSDLTGDGISDDDMGTAVKFNYTRVNKRAGTGNGNIWEVNRWRFPVQEAQANHNKGLKTDNSDDMASYTYGEKELWYTHSIESKNMVATFRISARRDGNGVKDENGGIVSNDPGGQKKLDRIDLYSKADFIRYNTNAKPVKTVHFEYSYDLCGKYPANDNIAVDVDNNDPAISGKPNININKGKLTLTSIYFTYNGNNKNKKNRYRFNYGNTAAENPEYLTKSNDRWGNYKDESANPPGMSNEDFPFTLQNKTQSDIYAAAWSLKKILLPSGAVMMVDYEADDYAYVQNLTAAQMTKIVGFSENQPATIADASNKLYKMDPTLAAQSYALSFNSTDFRFVVFEGTKNVANRQDVFNYYLKGLKQLLLKLWVKVPKDSYGQGYEPMFIYCNIEDWGIIPGSLNKFFVKVGKAGRTKGGSQIMETVMQYLRDQLPSKAFPGSDIGNKSAFGQVAKAIYAMAYNIYSGVLGFEFTGRMNGWCKEADLTKSFGRLNNPDLKKIGGGHRVKRITILDNWKKMVNGNNTPTVADSYYGQEYDYTKEEIINGQTISASSGVASYEPGVGNEENPFREVMQYSRRNPLGPTANSNVELPFGEMFFPSPSVGYSRVTVKSIHNKTNKRIKSGVGMQESTFYTTKDFPTVAAFTDFDNDSRRHYKPSPINKIFNFAKKEYMTMSQGFLITLNDMNGKPRTNASYSESDLKTPINSTAYYYRMDKIGENKYKLNNIVPVVKSADGKIENKLIGKDIEVMNDFREHFTFSHSAQIPINAEIFKIGAYPVIIPTLFRAVFRDERMFRSATTLKIVNEYGILDSVVNIDKGSEVSTKNLIYDAETGAVLVNRTKNEYNKPIYSFSYPAYWAQEEMGAAYKNIDGLFKNLMFRNGKIERGLTNEEVNSYFVSGDEILVYPLTDKKTKDNPACIAAGLSPAGCTLENSTAIKIWALDTRKDSRNTIKEFIFIDRDGKPFTHALVNIRIIRSGRRNQTGASVGSITSMAAPYTLLNNVPNQLLITDATNVVQAGAMEYKERWKTQDAFYWVNGTATDQRWGKIKYTTLGVQQSFAVSRRRRDVRGASFFPCFDNNTDHFFARNQSFNNRNDNRENTVHSKRKDRGWIKFNLSPLHANTKILSAKLNLYGHRTTHLYNYYYTGNTDACQKRGDGHNAGQPYFFSSPNSDYNYLLQRMLNPWPVNNDQWINREYYASAPAISDYSTLITISPRTYLPSYNLIGHDVKNIMQGMVDDYFNVQKQYAPALRINMSRDDFRGQDNGFCFNTGVGTSIPPPSIDIKYVDCNDLKPPGYIPEPGDTTVGLCTFTSPTKICYSVFTRDYINPYVYGLLGNWRAQKSFVYYDKRREITPVPQTNIAKFGIIDNFSAFWNFATAPDAFITKTNNPKWTWNSEISQYNRKGAELENFDPLKRFNSGIYGYNESLPVAIVNNSRLRNSAYDGFEDYYYEDQSCKLPCQPNKRHFETKIPLALLSTDQAHTGLYSLKIEAGSNTTIKAKVSPENIVTTPEVIIPNPDLKINLTKTFVPGIPEVIPKGLGLKGDFYDGPRNSGWWPPYVGTIAHDAPINYYYGYGASAPNNFPFGINRRGNTAAAWNGKLQVAETGIYNFVSFEVNDHNRFRINGQTVFERGNRNIPAPNIQVPITLTAGVLYDLEIVYEDGWVRNINNNAGRISFAWKTVCDPIWRLVPKENLYATAQEADGSIISPNSYCTKVNGIQAIKDYLIDGFNQIPETKMIASVWVKKGDADCRCPVYNGFEVKLRDSLNNEVAVFQPKGNIIEGWQLFEVSYTVPSNSSELKFFVNNPSGDNLYLDDLRFHPLSSNMKSFVYNPYNLKPAAELDENNYATFYEYDDDGGLIRVKKETIKGIKTIQETRSGLQKNITNF